LTRSYELDNQITESRVLDKAALMAGLSQISDAMVSIISTSGLSREAKEDLQRELAGIPIVLDDVATRQSKLPRNQNGQKDTGDEDDG
jgi:hypothetical protein